MLSEFDDLVAAMIAAGVPRTKAEACARARLGTSEAPAALIRDAAILEKTEQREIVNRLRAFGFRVYTLSQPRASKQTPGLADLWCTHTTQPIAFWWETKRQVGGAHRNTQNREVWSKRCPRVTCTPIDDPDYKRLTHRYERREAQRFIREATADAHADARSTPHAD